MLLYKALPGTSEKLHLTILKTQTPTKKQKQGIFQEEGETSWAQSGGYTLVVTSQRAKPGPSTRTVLVTFQKLSLDFP